MPSPLLQFNNIELDKVNNLSFSIAAGECKILQVPSLEVKSAVIEMAVGEFHPANGDILFQGQAIETCKPGSIGWIPANGGLISNLKAWENITLPLWFHAGRQTAATEQAVQRWLSELNFDAQEWERFMASPAAKLRPTERKLAGLMRGLVLSPQLMVIDSSLFDDVDEARIRVWLKAIEKFVHEADNRAALVIAYGETPLPWHKVENKQ